MLRYREDWRTVAYLAATAVLTVINWRLGSVHPVLYPVTLFFFFTSAVISHNHNHLGIWRSKPLNLLTSYVIALFSVTLRSPGCRRTTRSTTVSTIVLATARVLRSGSAGTISPRCLSIRR